jgi:hypothetical protein
MRIALLISGRATRYEVCLLPFLINNSKNYDIHLFMSINNKKCQYYEIMEEKLNKWLKGINIEEYFIPENIYNIFTNNPDKKIPLQNINDKWVPYNILSMFYNDNKSYNMAIKYQEENNIKYDIFMKFRSDILNFELNNIPYQNNLHLYNCVPICWFITHGIHKIKCLSDAIAWGNEETMKNYCSCYNFSIEKLLETKGEYYIAFEDTITDNILEKKIPYSFHKLNYHLDINRRIFDQNWNGQVGKRNDSRQNQIKGAKDIINIFDIKELDILPISQE